MAIVDSKQIRIGIDPGKKGFVAAIVERGSKIILYQLKYIHSNGVEILDCVGLVTFLRSIKDMDLDNSGCFVTLEKLHYIPKRMGGGTLFEMGRCFGALEAVLELMRFREVRKVRPCSWKKSMQLEGKDKDASILLAENYCARLNIKIENKPKKLTHDAAEAILLALL